MPFLYAVLICLHVLAAAFWVGGMATMHFAVRPAALQTLGPAERLGFMSAALSRFLNAVAVAIGVLLLSGAAMMALAGGIARLHWSVHLMLTLGLLMMAVFGHIRFSAFRRLQDAVVARDWAAAATSLNTIRRWVALNLLLGSVVFLVTFVGRAF